MENTLAIKFRRPLLIRGVDEDFTLIYGIYCPDSKIPYISSYVSYLAMIHICQNGWMGNITLALDTTNSYCFYYDEEEIQDTHKFIDENSTTIRLKLGLTYSIHIIPDGMDITDWCKDSLILDKELFEKLENWNDSDIQF